MLTHSYLIFIINAIILSTIDGYKNFYRINQINDHKFNHHIQKSSNTFTSNTYNHYHDYHNHHNSINYKNNKYRSSMTSLYDYINKHESITNIDNNNIFQSIGSQLKIVWDFTRPHTIVGSLLSIVCLYLYAIPPMYWKESFFIQSLLKSLIPSLFMNLYITGQNIIDVYCMYLCLFI